MLAAIVLLQVARRLSLPYPAMLAGAGVVVALIPGAPIIPIQPSTYLALFIAPALVDAAFDFQPGATRRFLVPLIAFAVFAVILTTGVVAWIGYSLLGLPLAAAVVLGLAVLANPQIAAAADKYPLRPITLIVPYGASGPLDTPAVSTCLGSNFKPVQRSASSNCCKRSPARDKIGEPCAKSIRSVLQVRSFRNERRISFSFEQYFRGRKVKPYGSKLISASPTMRVPLFDG